MNGRSLDLVIERRVLEGIPLTPEQASTLARLVEEGVKPVVAAARLPSSSPSSSASAVMTDAADEALCTLQARCSPVFVAGLSMGSLLALWLGGVFPGVPSPLPAPPGCRRPAAARRRR